MNKNITIQQVENREAHKVVAYVQGVREVLFPMLDHRQLPEDLLEFEKIYLNAQTGTFLKASDGEGRIVGVIGMRAYDYRFLYLDLRNAVVVEITRLFVEPRLRRTGLATNLFRTVASYACRQGVDICYLHTHPFLPGAREFWLKQGFTEITERKEADFVTIHMQCTLSEMQNPLRIEQSRTNNKVYYE